MYLIWSLQAPWIELTCDTFSLLRDPDTYIAYMEDALDAVPTNTTVSRDNVAIIVPYVSAINISSGSN